MKKNILVLASALTITAAGVVGTTGLVHAASVTSGTTSTSTNTSQKTKAHNRHIRLTARLNQAVRDGTITADQKTAFLTELKTLKTERKAAINKSSTTAERQAERAKLKSELQAWASTNNFPLSKIMPKLAS